MISHKNVIANAVMTTYYEKSNRNGRQDVALGLLPMSHIYVGLFPFSYESQT
jgi:long-subunit acyl-CoA synthetase (AMP-forming)